MWTPCLEYLRPCAVILLRLWRYISRTSLLIYLLAVYLRLIRKIEVERVAMMKFKVNMHILFWLLIVGQVLLGSH